MVEVAPYWNVNYVWGGNYPPLGSVEVAPYWNVNKANFQIIKG